MKRLNKKGFTLVELLAVIVVLAIIMVIATQAIGNVIKKNTVSSFKSSLDMVTKQAKQAEVMSSGTLLIGDVTDLVDYDDTQFTISFGTEPLDSNYICITSVEDGKFDDMDRTIFQTGEKLADNTTKWTTNPGYDNWSYNNGKTTACKKFR